MAHRIRPPAAAAVAAALLIVLSACVSPAASVSSSGSCAAILRFRGHTYYGAALRTHSPYTLTGRVPKAHMHVIGTGVLPACRDTTPYDLVRPVPGLLKSFYPPGSLGKLTVGRAMPPRGQGRPRQPAALQCESSLNDECPQRRAEVTYGAAAGFRA